MATENATGLSGHLRGVTVTTLACLAGLIAALVSASVIGTTEAAAESRQVLVVVLGATALQFPILKLVGVEIEEFGLKDSLYVLFMTFAFWFISYGVILSTNL